MKNALITGITGQDGSYLAELLLAKGYRVYGLVRRLSTPNTSRIDHILDQIHLIEGDLLDQSSLLNAIHEAQPGEVYNLAAMSHVGRSFSEPISTMEVTGLGTTRLLETIRLTGGYARFYQASTSEIIGQENQLSFQPRSPYACAKLYAHWTTINYRQAYGLYACAGILYNHESPRRGPDFVTRKITRGVAQIARGQQKRLVLGNLASFRDWGFAGDYVKAMWSMLQQPEPRDFVICTGQSHSVGEFVKRCFEYVGIHDWNSYVEIDADLYRPNEVDVLIGSAHEAHDQLGWKPDVNFDQLITMMMDAEILQEENHGRTLKAVH